MKTEQKAQQEQAFDAAKVLSLLDVIDNKNRIIEDKDRQLKHYEKLITLLEEQLHLSKLQRAVKNPDSRSIYLMKPNWNRR